MINTAFRILELGLGCWWNWIMAKVFGGLIISNVLS
jgi:hypothetical protein